MSQNELCMFNVICHFELGLQEAVDVDIQAPAQAKSVLRKRWYIAVFIVPESTNLNVLPLNLTSKGREQG